MKLAFKRLFLIMLPLSLLWVALFLSYTYPPEKILKTAPPLKKAGFWDSKCPFYLGVSFFPLREKKQDFTKSNQHFLEPWLSEKKFLQTLKKLKAYFQKEKLSPNRQLFALPLALTKEEEWIVSKKSFFISLSGERTELSHMTYESIKKISPNPPLKLEKVFSLLPKAHFLLYLQGSDQKIIKNLEKIQNKTTGDLYVSSLNEKLLSHISARGGRWRVLHSFKTLLRFQIMSPLRLNSFQSLTGDGIYIPSVLSPSAQMLSFLKKQKKLVFFEKDPPFNLTSQSLIGQAQALISSQPKLALKMAKIKKPCLIEN